MAIEVHCDIAECNNTASLPGGGGQPSGWARITWEAGTKLSPAAERMAQLKKVAASIPSGMQHVVDVMSSTMELDPVKRHFQAFLCPDCLGKVTLGAFQEVLAQHVHYGC